MNITTMEQLEQLPVGAVCTVEQRTGVNNWTRVQGGLRLGDSLNTLPLRNFESYLPGNITVPDDMTQWSDLLPVAEGDGVQLRVGMQVTRESDPDLYSLPVGTVIRGTSVGISDNDYTIMSDGPAGRMSGGGRIDWPLSAQSGTFTIVSLSETTVTGAAPDYDAELERLRTQLTAAEAAVHGLEQQVVTLRTSASNYGEELSGALSEYINDHGHLSSMEREDLIEVMTDNGLEFTQPMEDVDVTVVIDGYTDVSLSAEDLQEHIDSDLTADDSAEIEVSWRVTLTRSFEVAAGTCACDQVDGSVVEEMLDSNNISYSRVSDYHTEGCVND